MAVVCDHRDGKRENTEPQALRILQFSIETCETVKSKISDSETLDLSVFMLYSYNGKEDSQ